MSNESYNKDTGSTVYGIGSINKDTGSINFVIESNKIVIR